MCCIVILTAFASCKITYSFSGASISPDVETVFIEYFPNRARVVNPTLSQTLTEGMKDKFVNETSLTLDRDEGDLEISGEITRYEIRPLSIQQSTEGRDFASQNRLTITIKVKFANNQDHEQDYNSTFSAYYDWDSSLSLNSVENEAIEAIVEQLVEDVFNKSVANW